MLWYCQSCGTEWSERRIFQSADNGNRLRFCNIGYVTREKARDILGKLKERREYLAFVDDTRYGHSYNGRRIGTRRWSIERCHLPWVLLCDSRASCSKSLWNCYEVCVACNVLWLQKCRVCLLSFTWSTWPTAHCAASKFTMHSAWRYNDWPIMVWWLQRSTDLPRTTSITGEVLLWSSVCLCFFVSVCVRKIVKNRRESFGIDLTQWRR